jgi:hypothetical protein
LQPSGAWLAAGGIWQVRRRVRRRNASDRPSPPQSSSFAVLIAQRSVIRYARQYSPKEILPARSTYGSHPGLFCVGSRSGLKRLRTLCHRLQRDTGRVHDSYVSFARLRHIPSLANTVAVIPSIIPRPVYYTALGSRRFGRHLGKIAARSNYAMKCHAPKLLIEQGATNGQRCRGAAPFQCTSVSTNITQS